MVTVNVESLFTCGWVIPTILLLCHIMWEAYFHLIVFIVLYYVYKIITRQNVKKIVTNGQGVFITGCDTGKISTVLNKKKKKCIESNI